MSSYSVPEPRTSVANPNLTRPDWLKEKPRDSRLLWLDKNENTDPTLLALTRKVLGELDPAHLALYPEMAAFYRKLAAGENVSPESLLLAAGSDGVIRTVFETFISPGDVVLHTVPTFAMYPVYCMIFGAKPLAMEYAPSDRGPVLKAQQILSAIETHRPRLVCVPNPDSPTGTVFSAEEMRAIIKKAAEVGAVALIDEAYHPFYAESVAAWTTEFKNLVVARTFSKAWGLAGLRTGYAIAHPELSRILHRVRPMYEVNTVAIGYIERMLDFRDEIHASVKRLIDGKRYFNRAMQELGFKTYESQGNFTHVAFGAKQLQIFAALESLVLYRKDFKDPCLAGYSRFTVAPESIFSKVVERIAATARSAQ